MRSLLVTGEVALALVVVVSASLLVRSLNKLLEVQPGFRPDHLLVASLALPPMHYKQTDVHNFYVRLLPKIAAVPGVVSVATTTALPLATAVTHTRFAVQGMTIADPGRYPVAAIASVDAEYFRTMGIPILRGRTFSRDEIGNDDERCIISATLAHNFFGSQDPVGRSLLTNLAATAPEPCRIVGVAGDTRLASLEDPLQPVLYFASYAAKEVLVVRTATDPLAMAPAIQREIATADPEQPLSGIRSMDQVLARSLSRRSFPAILLVAFAAIGLILAALGLYGVVSYSVAQRTPEIGIRMAMGAEPRGIFRMILSQGLLTIGTGLVAGWLGAIATTRMMSSLLFGIAAADPLSFVAGGALILSISALACFVPAYRAARVDPLVALRYE
jgi:putative ABC transport system permease protein